MAEKVTVELVDDLDGSAAEETIQFSVNGSAYRIDVSKKNSDAFWKALKPYIDAAQPATSSARSVTPVPKAAGARRRRSSGAAAAGVDPKAVRVWADENGKQVPSRGRIPKPLLEEYVAATGG
ncbi:MAG: Lsr2 family protein [Acidimicrobiales bacterium]